MNTDDIPESAVEAMAKAMFEHEVKTARARIDDEDLGLQDAEEFLLGLRKESDAALAVLAHSYIEAHLTEA